MGLPISKRKVNELGERLMGLGTVPEEDSQLLEQVLACYDVARETVQSRLRSVGYPVTGRTKNTGTVIEKLTREKHLKLSQIQDLAGVRIVLDGGHRDQDECVRHLSVLFGSAVKRSVDRREDPRSGYRAVHVIVLEDDLPVEIQVRTALQDVWAQAYESFGDIWGRAIRYGGDPESPDSEVVPGVTRRDTVVALRGVSDALYYIELANSHLDKMEATLAFDRPAGAPEDVEAAHQALLAEREGIRAKVAALELEVRSNFEIIVRSASRGASSS